MIAEHSIVSKSAIGRSQKGTQIESMMQQASKAATIEKLEEDLAIVV